MGKIEVICGPMYSGKTEELIRRLTRLKIANKEYTVLKSYLDQRYDEFKIATHNGNKMESEPIFESDEFISLVNTNIAAIDEVQFLDKGIVDRVREYAEFGGRVILSGLDMDFRQEPFGPMPELLAIADTVTKLTAVCNKCGADATFTQRLVNGKPTVDGETIVVGAMEMYEARCRECWENDPTALKVLMSP